MKTIIRASSLPRVMACPASMRAPEIDIHASGPEAALGTAVHEVLADLVKERLEALPDLSPYAKKHGVDEDELRFLAWRGQCLWREFGPRIDPESVLTEQKLSAIDTAKNEDGDGDEIELVGHLDVCGLLAGAEPPTLVIIDWKSGYVDRDYRDQLMGYALLARVPYMLSAKFTNVKIVTAWLRTGAWDVIDLTPADIGNFSNRLRDAVNSTSRYAPDDAHCVFCPRLAECPAREALVRCAADSLYPIAAGDDAGILSVRDKLAELYDRVKLLERGLDQYRDALRLSIRADGPLQLPDGRWLTVHERSRETILFDFRAASALAPYLDHNANDISGIITALGPGAITAKKTSLLDAVAARAGRGQKKAAKESAMRDLAAAGCVGTKTYDTLAVVKDAGQIEHKETA